MMIPLFRVENYALWAQVVTACATSLYTIWIIGTAVRKRYFPPCPVQVVVRAHPMGESKTICRCDVLVANPSGGSVDIPHISAIKNYELGLLEEQRLDDEQFLYWHDVLPTAILVGVDKEFAKKDAFLLKKAEHVSWFHAKLRMRLWVTTSQRRTYKVEVIPYFVSINP
jgi:hypothetical protein